MTHCRPFEKLSQQRHGPAKILFQDVPRQTRGTLSETGQKNATGSTAETLDAQLEQTFPFIFTMMQHLDKLR